MAHDLFLALAERRGAPGLTQPGQILPERHADTLGAPLERGPDDVAGQPELIEPRGLVALEPWGQELLLPEPERKVLALERLERREQSRRADEAVVGMHVLAPQHERGEHFGRRDRVDDPARVSLPALDLVEHGDVDVLRLAQGAARLGRVEHARDVGLGGPVAPGQQRHADGPAAADGPEQDALECLRVGRRPAGLRGARVEFVRDRRRADGRVHRGLQRRDPRVAAGPEVDRAHAALGAERVEHRLGIRRGALGNLRGREIAQLLEESRQLVRVAGAPLGRGLLKLGDDGGDDVGLERSRRDMPRLAHHDCVAPPLLGMAGVEIRPVPREQQRVDER